VRDWQHRLRLLRSHIQKEDTVLAFATMAILALPVFQWFLALTKAVGAASAVGDNTSNPLKRTVGTLAAVFPH
jgi:hypothetical protein